MSAEDIILVWMFPLIGGVVGCMMFGAPMLAVLAARRERVLGDLNPLPFPAQVANAAGWLGYSYVLASTDLQASAMLFWVNQIGLLLGVFFMLSCYGLANTKTKDRQLAILLFFTFVLSLVAAIGVMTRMSSLKQLWGFTANAILLVYYAAPLSTIFTVISTRSAATLNVPLAVMQLINGSTWCAYGLAKADPFIWVPNGIGAASGTLCLILLFMFGRSKKYQGSPAPSDVDTNSSQHQMTNNETCNGGAVTCLPQQP